MTRILVNGNLVLTRRQEHPIWTAIRPGRYHQHVARSCVRRRDSLQAQFSPYETVGGGIPHPKADQRSSIFEPDFSGCRRARPFGLNEGRRSVVLFMKNVLSGFQPQVRFLLCSESNTTATRQWRHIERAISGRLDFLDKAHVRFAAFLAFRDGGHGSPFAWRTVGVPNYARNPSGRRRYNLLPDR